MVNRCNKHEVDHQLIRNYDMELGMLRAVDYLGCRICYYLDNPEKAESLFELDDYFIPDPYAPQYKMYKDRGLVKE